MPDKIKVAIVGCGKIGYSGYVKNNIDSHYKALKRPGIDLDLYDNVNKIGRSDFSSTKEKYDCIIVSVNTENHYEVYTQAVSKSPELIILEKPAGSSLDEFNKMRALGHSKTIINYTRRLNGDLDTIKNICNSAIGQPIYINCIYNKSLQENGCHFIDSVIYLFGVPEHFEKKDNRTTLFYSGFNADFISVNSKEYTEQRIHIYGEKNKIELNQGCMEQRVFEKSLHPCGYTQLTHAMTYVGRLNDSCEHIRELVYKYTSPYKKEVPSGFKDAIHTAKIVYG